ncbi:hypothetical protein EDD15DRAFT_615708 [Pisolithus albus]|nr:hypothetical protein EDD15DRAFT_615708 [Pisolithus albus]
MIATRSNAGRHVHAKHEDSSKPCLYTKIPSTYLSIETVPRPNNLSLRSSSAITDANWSNIIEAASPASAFPFGKSVEDTGLPPESSTGSTVTSTRHSEPRFHGEERPNKRPRGLEDLLSAYIDSSDTGDDSDVDHPGNCYASMEIADASVESEDSPTHRIPREENTWMNWDESGGEAAEDHHMALGLARVVVHLCHSQYHPPAERGGQRGVGASAAELGDILDPDLLHVPRAYFTECSVPRRRSTGFCEGRSRGVAFWGRPPMRWLYFPRSFSFLTVIFFDVCMGGWRVFFSNLDKLIPSSAWGEETTPLRTG